MASSRVFASRLATSMASTTTKVARPALRFQLNTVPKRTFTDVSSGLRAQRKDAPFATAFQTPKRQLASNILKANVRQVFSNYESRRHYSSEIAQAMVEVSKNMGMGSAAIGLGGAGIGIGLVFGALLMGVSRNPALRGQLFTYAILGFAFVEAIGLFDLMVAMMCKYV
ncbi:putative ATP synthase subunit ATP9 [Thermoascus aurantiacus ATCC 26904]